MDSKSFSCKTENVSRVGFGAWGIGGSTSDATSYGDTDDNESAASLLEATNQGITFFDTAPAYGNGHSEELIGQLSSIIGRGNLFIATKGGYRTFDSPPDFSFSSLVNELDQSLGRMQVDHVDLYQLHSQLFK